MKYTEKVKTGRSEQRSIYRFQETRNLSLPKTIIDLRRVFNTRMVEILQLLLEYSTYDGDVAEGDVDILKLPAVQL